MSVFATSYKVEIKIDGSNWTDVTNDVIRVGETPHITGSRGSAAAQTLRNPETGEALFVLDNTSGDYDFSVNLGGRPVRISGLYSAVNYNFWYGQVDAVTYSSVFTRPIVIIRALGGLAFFAGKKL